MLSMVQALNPMKRDEELFQEFDLSQETKPIFFFYTWDELAISIGKIQRKRGELIKEAEALGIPCYLRPTGGRAVLHGSDICYTFIGTQNDNEFGGTMQESFKKVNLKIIELINVAINSKKLLPSSSSLFVQSDSDKVVCNDSKINCFSSSVSNEGLINGQKILGAAQAMGSRSFIQQGSIQVNPVTSNLSYFKDTPNLTELINNGEPWDLKELCSTLNLCLI